MLRLGAERCLKLVNSYQCFQLTPVINNIFNIVLHQWGSLPGMDKVRKQGVPLPGNDKEN